MPILTKYISFIFMLADVMVSSARVSSVVMSMAVQEWDSACCHRLTHTATSVTRIDMCPITNVFYYGLNDACVCVCVCVCLRVCFI